MEFFKKADAFVCNIFVIVAAVLISVFTIVNINSFYSKQYHKLNIDVPTGMSFEDLDRTTAVLLDYLNDEKDNLSVIVEKHGVPRQAFYERETLHMVDVKNLYINAKRVMSISFVVIGLSMIALIFTCKKDFGRFMFYMRQGYKKRLVAFIVFFAVMGLCMAIDFNWFWTNFHLIFFDNDLWLLDPRYSTMINMFPEQFFFAMCTRILFLFGGIFAVYSFCIIHTAKRTPVALAE